MAEMQEKEPQTTTPLAALGGKLGSSFAAASDVTRLHRTLIDNQPENNRTQASDAIAAFYAAAEKAGWHEARIFPPGTAMMFDRSKTDTRITVDTDRFGNVKRFRQG